LPRKCCGVGFSLDRVVAFADRFRLWAAYADDGAAIHVRLDFDPQAFELTVVERRLDVRVEHLDRSAAVIAIRNAFAVAQDDRRDVLLPLDLALRGETHPRQLCPHDLAELRLRQQQHVLRPSAPDEERRDHARLRREQQRVHRPLDRDVVGKHPVQILDRVLPRYTHVGARATGRCRGQGRHAI